LGLYALTVVLALAVIIFLVYPFIMRVFGKRTIKQFYKAAAPVQMLAFTTSSSAATLPLTLERTQKHLGVSEEVSSFVLPVGVTINMDGTSCYQAVAAVFLAQVLGLDLTFGQMLLILATATISSIGTPGIPGGSIVMLMIVLDSVGIPIEGLALILGIDRPLDMLRTVVNVTGDMTVSCVVDNTKK
jgi:Na+/H+-dicarboxylate symporter